MNAEFYLSEMPDKLHISQINLPGSHDSATAFVDFKTWARCQTLTISQQLKIGIRLLDIRLCCEGGRFPLIHSASNCYTNSNNKERLYFEQVYNECLSFLKSHPLETIVMIVKMDRGFRKNHFAKLFYDKFIYEKEDCWYLENKIPTLSEVRGKIVLMRRFVKPFDYKKYKHIDNCGMDFSVWENQKSKKPVPPFDTNFGNGCYAEIQDGYNLSVDDKWNFAIKPFLNRCKSLPNKICLHCLNTSGDKGIPEENSKYINEKFYNFQLSKEYSQGWFLFDFPTKSLIDKIIESNTLHF